jgi:MFS family permease
MDSAGASIGPLLALGLLAAGLSLRQVIVIAIVPGLLTMLVLRSIREVPGALATPGEAAAAASRGSMRALPGAFWSFTGAWTVFSLGNSADVFLLLRASDLGLSTSQVVAAYALFNLIYSGLSFPLGHLSDRVGKRRVLAGGLLVFAAVYAGFGLVGDDLWVWPLMAVYGVYIAATDGVGKAYVSDLTPVGERATGQGAFRLFTGLATVVASIVAGVLWQAVGPAAVFAVGAGMAVAGLAALVVLRPVRRTAAV